MTHRNKRGVPSGSIGAGQLGGLHTSWD